MIYELESQNHDLIHILRFIMYPEGVGVLDREWEFRYLFGAIAYPWGHASEKDRAVFPEYMDKTPFKVDGVRLIQRAALVFHFEDTELVRLCESSNERDWDLRILADIALPLEIQTSDSELYTRLGHYLEMTRSDSYKDFFW